jgi:hypothetical protein
MISVRIRLVNGQRTICIELLTQTLLEINLYHQKIRLFQVIKDSYQVIDLRIALEKHTQILQEKDFKRNV